MSSAMFTCCETTLTIIVHEWTQKWPLEALIDRDCHFYSCSRKWLKFTFLHKNDGNKAGNGLHDAGWALWWPTGVERVQWFSSGTESHHFYQKRKSHKLRKANLKLSNKRKESITHYRCRDSSPPCWGCVHYHARYRWCACRAQIMLLDISAHQSLSASKFPFFCEIRAS